MTTPAGLVCGIAVSVGVWLGFPALAICATIAAGVVWFRWRDLWWRLALVLACVGLGAFRHQEVHTPQIPAYVGQTDRARGEVISIPLARAGGERAMLRIEEVRLNNTWQPLSGTVVVYLPPDQSVDIGNRVEVVWEFRDVRSLFSSYANWVRSQDAIGIANIWFVEVLNTGSSPIRYLTELRRTVAHQMATIVPDDAGALMAGIVTGDDSALSEETRDSLVLTNTVHITAVSGSNVALLLAFWGRLVRSKTRQRQLLVVVAIVCSIWVYVATTGMEPSALRAAAVGSMVVASRFLWRIPDPMTVLAISTAALLLWDPSLAREIGFQLSLCGSAALISTIQLKDLHTPADVAKSGLLALVAAQCATTPLVAHMTGVVSPIGLIANVFVSPVIAVAFPLSFVFAIVSFVPGLNQLLAIPAAMAADFALSIINRLAEIAPHLLVKPDAETGMPLLVFICLTMLIGLNRDMRRWIPRFGAMVQEQPVAAWSLVSGIAAGSALALVTIAIIG